MLVERLTANQVIARNTSMPFNNAIWGEEKAEMLLKEIILGIHLLNENETRKDSFKDSDFKANMKGRFSQMAYNITKLYAFFCDGHWEVKDRDLIIEKGEEGFKQIKKAYKPNYKNISDEDTETVESRS